MRNIPAQEQACLYSAGLFFLLAVKRRPGLKRLLKKCLAKQKSVPQRLKPHYERDNYGTAEAVPLSKTDFFSTL
jgi:hypothetical protein